MSDVRLEDFWIWEDHMFYDLDRGEDPGRKPRRASVADLVAALLNEGGGWQMGWCPRGGGHWDMPESPDAAGDHGGSKWVRRYLVVPLEDE